MSQNMFAGNFISGLSHKDTCKNSYMHILPIHVTADRETVKFITMA